MRIKRIEKFTLSVTKGLLSTQQATISQVVCSILVCRCLILAEIARCFQSETLFPHNLKRTWRFVSNERLQDQASKEVVARRLINQLHHRLEIKPKDYLEIIIDWTSVHPFQVLSALVPVEGGTIKRCVNKEQAVYPSSCQKQSIKEGEHRRDRKREYPIFRFIESSFPTP